MAHCLAGEERQEAVTRACERLRSLFQTVHDLKLQASTASDVCCNFFNVSVPFPSALKKKKKKKKRFEKGWGPGHYSDDLRPACCGAQGHTYYVVCCRSLSSLGCLISCNLAAACPRLVRGHCCGHGKNSAGAGALLSYCPPRDSHCCSHGSMPVDVCLGQEQHGPPAATASEPAVPEEALAAGNPKVRPVRLAPRGTRHAPGRSFSCRRPHRRRCADGGSAQAHACPH